VYALREPEVPPRRGAHFLQILKGLGVATLTGVVAIGLVQCSDGGGPNSVSSPMSREPQTYIRVSAKDMAFNTSLVVSVAESGVTVEISNLDATVHTFGVFRDAGGRMPLLPSERIEPGQVVERTFTTPPPGSYIFRCDIHPGQMLGSFVTQ
jgi:plastocyanin